MGNYLCTKANEQMIEELILNPTFKAVLKKLTEELESNIKAKLDSLEEKIAKLEEGNDTLNPLVKPHC